VHLKQQPAKGQPPGGNNHGKENAQEGLKD
jgi:hypothetical protein